jgi:pantoate--beta-alanine ligase
MTAPQVVSTVAELRRWRGAMTDDVAVVMTMGALHEGHASLIRLARDRCATVIVTIFVNPLQFGPGEDLDRYPRTLDADLAMCAREDVALVFAPDREELYPYGDPVVRVSAGELADVLEGAHRPGHFDGVLTVVNKLLNLTRPAVAVFGEKDAQQLAVIKRMVRDLDMAVEIVTGPLVREPDGLAMSSRNRYLSDSERKTALRLNRALETGAAVAVDGPAAVLAAAAAELAAESALDVDYLALVDDETWAPATDKTVAGRLLVAARIGATRLIDNVPVDLGTPVG